VHQAICRKGAQFACFSYLLSEPTNSWERVDTPVNEGPAALYKNGAIYLAFSASFCEFLAYTLLIPQSQHPTLGWTPAYSLGLLKYNGGTVTSASSWVKTGPHFTTANGHYGPGHNGFFNSPDGYVSPCTCVPCHILPYYFKPNHLYGLPCNCQC
jgi:GH43 family beta-xylosidase